MENHVHMVIRVGFEDFEWIFKRLNVSFAMYHHKRNKSVGHGFQARVKKLFDMSHKKYKVFHRIDDHKLYLEIEEDQ